MRIQSASVHGSLAIERVIVFPPEKVELGSAGVALSNEHTLLELKNLSRGDYSAIIPHWWVGGFKIVKVSRVLSQKFYFRNSNRFFHFFAGVQQNFRFPNSKCLSLGLPYRKNE